MTTRVEVVDGWERPIQRWAAVRADGLAQSTIRTRITCLRNLARHCQTAHPSPVTVTPHDLAAYINARTWRATTYQNNVKAVRAFYRWLTGQGLTVIDPACTLPVALTGADVRRLNERAAHSSFPVRTGPDPLPVPEVWAVWLEDWRRYLRAAGTSPATVQTRLTQLRQVAREMDPLNPDQVSVDDLIDVLSRDSWRPDYRRWMRSTLRAFYRWAVAVGRVEVSPADGLPVVRASIPVPRPAPELVIRDALGVADDRVRLMLRLAGELGLRRAEVAGLHVSHLVRGDTGWTLTVRGKGGRTRYVPVTDGLVAAVRAFAPGGGFVFPGQCGGHLAPKTVGDLVGRVLPPGVTMHMLRHRFATRGYQVAGDLLAVQQLLGHSSVATTQRYVALDAAALRSVVESVARTT